MQPSLSRSRALRTTRRAGDVFVGGIVALSIVSCSPSAERTDHTGEAQVAVSPSFDCTAPRSSAEELVCGDADLARLDLSLDSVFTMAVASTAGMADGSAAAAELRAVQRGWIKGRDECWKAEDLRRCVDDAYRRRTAELEAQFMLREGSSPVFWICGGNPADEFVTTFYDTDPPTARIERGDRTMVALLSPSASGSRYEGPFGAVFWTKGTEAQVEWPQGTRWSCVAR